MGLEYAGAVVSTRSAPAGHGGQTVCGNIRMKLTAVSLPAKEGGYLLRGGNSRRDFEGETLAKANANLLDALKLVVESQRDLVEKDLSPEAVRELIELPDA